MQHHRLGQSLGTLAFAAPQPATGGLVHPRAGDQSQVPGLAARTGLEVYAGVHFADKDHMTGASPNGVAVILATGPPSFTWLEYVAPYISVEMCLTNGTPSFILGGCWRRFRGHTGF